MHAIVTNERLRVRIPITKDVIVLLVTVSAMVYIQEIFIFTFLLIRVRLGDSFWRVGSKMQNTCVFPLIHFCVSQMVHFFPKTGRSSPNLMQKPDSVLCPKRPEVYLYIHIFLYTYTYTYTYTFKSKPYHGNMTNLHQDVVFFKRPASSSHWEKNVKPPSQPRYDRQLHQTGTDNQNVQAMPNWVSDG